MSEFKEVKFSELEIGAWFKLRPGTLESYQKKGFDAYYEGKTLGEVHVLPWATVYVTGTIDDGPIAHV